MIFKQKYLLFHNFCRCVMCKASAGGYLLNNLATELRHKIGHGKPQQ